METGFSGLGKIPVVQDETEVDAREEIPDCGKYLARGGGGGGGRELLLERTTHGSQSNVARLIIPSVASYWLFYI